MPRLTALTALTAVSALIVLTVLSAAPLAAQHSYATTTDFNPAVPTPRSVLGYEVGERFTPHHLLSRYMERVAIASPRVALDTMAMSFGGRETLLAIVTSEANHARMAQIRADAERVANPVGGPAPELQAALDRLPAIVFLAYTVHGGEASGTEAAIATLYHLAAGQDAETLRMLENTVVLIDPVQNPDGHERHVQRVWRTTSMSGHPNHPSAMINQGDWPGARTSHYGFDLNRDWFILSHPESRGRVGVITSWWPHVVADLHEMGSSSSYFFAPPMEPVNKNVPQNIKDWWDIVARANAEAMDRYGRPYFTREGYDEFWPGYGVSYPILTGSVGMTYEQASSSGGRIRRNDGTDMTLHIAAWQHYLTSMATIRVSAERARERVRDYLEFRRTAITESERAPMRAVAFERDRDGRADSLALLLSRNGIQVHRTTAAADILGATPYGETAARNARLGAGTYIVDLAQPQGRLARAILEPDAVLDSTFIREELERRRTGQGSRFYDVTAWSLPMTFRLNAWALRTVPAGAEPVEWISSEPSSFLRAISAYAFEPGSEASLQMLAGLLADSVRVRLAQRAFQVGSDDFPRGAFLVQVAANDTSVHQRVAYHAARSGARIVPLNTALVTAGTDLGSNSVIPVRPARVGLVGGQGVGGNTFGFAWFMLDQRFRYPVLTVEASSLANALRDLDVVIIPGGSAGGLDNALGENGRTALTAWVRGGGVLITIEGATSWLARESVGLTRLRARVDTASGPGGMAPLPVSVPGAIVRVTADTLSPLMAGIRDTEFPVMVSGGFVLGTPRNLRPGEAVLRYAPQARLRLAGYLWPEAPGRLAEAPYLWTESVGQGRIIAFAGDPNFRDLWRGLLPVFGNAVFLGGSF
ncbi:MAG: M14 family zinc carboxypeptidase [Gemmatimonadales bacterium]